MHQAHNIPWHLIESNFKLIRENKHLTPPVTGLFPKDNPNAPQELKHFVKKFVETIRTFSDTERKKYPAKMTPLYDGNVFSDELRDKYPEYLNERNQAIKYWIACFENRGYNGELMDIVNVLLCENQMETLLMLTQHPKINMASLHYYSWGHHFGFCRTKEAAAVAYLFFNAADATGCLENGVYTQFPDYRYLISQISHTMDHSAQQIPHIRFFRECGVHYKEPRDVIVHQDYGRLQEYLKTLFALMYRYDVLAREAGLDPEWEEEIARDYPLNGFVKLKWVEAERKHILV